MARRYYSKPTSSLWEAGGSGPTTFERGQTSRIHRYLLFWDLVWTGPRLKFTNFTSIPLGTTVQVSRRSHPSVLEQPLRASEIRRRMFFPFLSLYASFPVLIFSLSFIQGSSKRGEVDIFVPFPAMVNTMLEYLDKVEFFLPCLVAMAVWCDAHLWPLSHLLSCHCF